MYIDFVVTLRDIKGRKVKFHNKAKTLSANFCNCPPILSCYAALTKFMHHLMRERMHLEFGILFP